MRIRGCARATVGPWLLPDAGGMGRASGMAAQGSVAGRLSHMHRDALQAVFDARELDRLISLMDEAVVWRGVPTEDEIPICRDRGEVRDTMQHFIGHGGDAEMVILGERGDSVLVDVRPRPGETDHDGGPTQLYQVFTFRGDRIALIQDYGDREAARAALGF